MPKPSIMRSERGMARSDMTQMTMCMLSGISEMKSQNVSCAEAACGIAAVRLHLHRMDEIGKLDRVLDEEHRDVVADEIEIALVGVELDREAAHVARHVARAGAAGDGGEPREDLGLLASDPARNAALVSLRQSTWSAGNSRGRRSRARERCAREFARDRNG